MHAVDVAVMLMWQHDAFWKWQAVRRLQSQQQQDRRELGARFGIDAGKRDECLPLLAGWSQMLLSMSGQSLPRRLHICPLLELMLESIKPVWRISRYGPHCGALARPIVHKQHPVEGKRLGQPSAL